MRAIRAPIGPSGPRASRLGRTRISSRRPAQENEMTNKQDKSVYRTARGVRLRTLGGAITLALSVLLTAMQAKAEDAAEYDVIIRGGHIIDGTGNPWFIGDVAIKADRIAAVGRLPH